MIDYEYVSMVFEDNGYEWNDGDPHVPTADELEETVIKSVDLLDGKDEGLVEIGRLIVIKRDNRFDLYVHMGEINANS